MTRPLLTIEEAAAVLRVSRRWLNEWLGKNPDCYIPAGRKKRLDHADVERIKARLREGNRCRSRSGHLARGIRRTGRSVERISDSTLTAALELATSASP